MERGPDGMYRGVIAGRSWVLTPPTGSEAWALYMAIQGVAAKYGAAESRQAAQAAVGRVLYDADAQGLMVATLQRMTCDGVPVAGAFDAVFPAHRVHEIPAIASEAWLALGFLTPPGMLPAPAASTTTA